MGEIVGVYVTPRHRGSGVAQRLMVACCDWAADQGCDVVKLMVMQTNERAAAFYRRIGFQPTGVTMPYPPDSGYLEVEMQSTVSPSRPVIVLLTGMSGAGKSSTLAELARRGHQVVDTDDPGWIVEAATPEGAEPHWHADRITELLDQHRQGWLFIGGCVVNQGRFYDRFDAVVLLSAPDHVLISRVAQRSDGYGSTPEDRAKIASDRETYEPLLRAGATHEIVTAMQVADIATEVERIATETRR